MKEKMNTEKHDLMITVKKQEISISPEEYKIICLISEGLIDKEIAEKMGKNYHTLRQRINSLFQKANAHTRLQLVNWAYKNKVLQR